ncbi:MAG: ATP-grasp domain-containing protein [bacterium]
MSRTSRVLVVGTTSDYVDWLRRHAPGRTLFLTDRRHRERALEPAPPAAEELLAHLEDLDGTRRALGRYLAEHSHDVQGVTCFDCESLELAARVAADLGLPYPSVDAVRICRDKGLQHERWRAAGLPCPRTSRVHSAADAARFLGECKGGQAVLKPATGGGSELVFRVSGPADCERAFSLIRRGLEARRDHRMYRVRGEERGAGNDPAVVAEELVTGEEYSADFLLEDDAVRLLRLARKVGCSRSPFGTIRGYLAPVDPPPGLDSERLVQTLRRSATSLGIERSICMVDFFVRDGELTLLELAPRPGGDCLPALLRQACGLDILVLALDFAARRPLGLDGLPRGEPRLGLRLHASRAGVLRAIDATALAADPRVQEVQLIRRPPHVVRLPPADYDSWLLGHAVAVPNAAEELDEQCERLHALLNVEIGA